MTVGLSKALVALVVAVLAALAQAVGSGAVDDLGTYDWVQTAAIILGGAAITAVIDNIPGVLGGVARALVGAATSGLAAWQVAYENDHVITQGEWLGVAIAVIGALSAVYQKAERRVVTLS